MALAVGVTGMVKACEPPPDANPAAIVHVTFWPAALQPAGSVPIVRPVGMASLIVDVAVVSAVPVLVTVMV